MSETDINSLEDNIYMVRNHIQCDRDVCDAFDRIVEAIEGDSHETDTNGTED